MRYTIYNLKKKGKNSFFFLLIVILVATIILSTSMFNLWGEKVHYGKLWKTIKHNRREESKL